MSHVWIGSWFLHPSERSDPISIRWENSVEQQTATLSHLPSLWSQSRASCLRRTWMSCKKRGQRQNLQGLLSEMLNQASLNPGGLPHCSTAEAGAQGGEDSLPARGCPTLKTFSLAFSSAKRVLPSSTWRESVLYSWRRQDSFSFLPKATKSF